MPTNRKEQADWMRQAAACRRTYAKTHDAYWAAAARNSVSAARAYRMGV